MKKQDLRDGFEIASWLEERGLRGVKKGRSMGLAPVAKGVFGKDGKVIIERGVGKGSMSGWEREC